MIGLSEVLRSELSADGDRRLGVLPGPGGRRTSARAARTRPEQLRRLGLRRARARTRGAGELTALDGPARVRRARARRHPRDDLYIFTHREFREGAEERFQGDAGLVPRRARNEERAEAISFLLSQRDLSAKCWSGAPSEVFPSSHDRGVDDMSGKCKVLNPEGYPPKVSARGMAPSLDWLEGKKVFLVDVGFANSDNFIAQLHGWFERQPADDRRPRSSAGATSTCPIRSSASASRPTATRPSSASAPDRAARRRSPATSSTWRRSTGSRPWGCTLERLRAARAQQP